MIHFLYNHFLTPKPSTNKTKLYRMQRWRLYNYLNTHLVKYYKSISNDSLGTDKTSNVIVSLTSFPARIEVVYLAVKSMLNQTVVPQKIVLWLGKDQFPNNEDDLPNSLLELKSCGLEIEFCEDIGAHTKYYYAFQKYPNNLIVTVDDDIIYPRDMLEKLLQTYQNYPHAVVANRVRNIETDDNHFKPYTKWKVNRASIGGPSKKGFATGVGGVLYQPHLFQKSIYDIEGIRKTNCIGDDIWLKAAQIISGIPVVSTNYYFKQFIEIPESQKVALFKKNVFERENDRQIKEVFEYFGVTVESID